MNLDDLFKESEIPYLNNSEISLEDRKNKLLDYAKVGYLVNKNLNISLTNNENDSFIRLLDSKINIIQNDINSYNNKVCDLDKNLDILVGNVKNPAFKGKIGENFLEHSLKVY